MPNNQKKKEEKQEIESSKNTVKKTSKNSSSSSKKKEVSQPKKSTTSTKKKSEDSIKKEPKSKSVKSSTTKPISKTQEVKKNKKVEVVDSKKKVSTQDKKDTPQKKETSSKQRSSSKKTSTTKSKKKELEQPVLENEKKEVKKLPKKKEQNKKKSKFHFPIKSFSIKKINIPSLKKEKSKKKISFPKFTLISNLKESLKNRKSPSTIKKLDKKKTPKKVTTSKSNQKAKNSVYVIPKKWMIGIIVLCVSIIVIEAIYFIYHKIDVEHNTIYYDSLNSITVDNTDIVLVGSSHFRYSKYYSYTKGLEKAKLIKYDYSGKISFEKMYEKGINTTFSSIISVDDGYVVVGSGEFSEEENQDDGREAIIIKYDKQGNLVWEKYYQVVTNTRFNKVIEVEDGYVAIGQSIYANMEMGNHTTGGGIIVKYDKNGNEVWHNNHGGMKSGNFNDIVSVNGNFYVVGKDATDSGNLVKYNSNGEYQWHKNYRYTDGIGFTGIVYLDQNLYVVGSKKVLPEGTGDDDNRDTTNTDALLVKYDLDGNIEFEKSFGGSNYERYNSILAYRDNLYIVGHTTSKDAGLKVNTDGELMTGMLVRYDKNGNILKKETLGGSNNDNLTDIATDGVSLYVSAYSNSKDGNITTAKNNGKDYFGKFIKLDFKFRTLLIK